MSASILAAVDLAHEEASAAVLKRAAEIAALDGATLSVITVIPDFGSSFVSSFFDDDAMPKALEEANAALHAFVDKTLPGHGAVRHITGNGGVYDEVLKAADQISADMVVIGAAKPTVPGFELGPNAARVARNFSGSVLIVR
ncbi:MAG: universal stress protein [Pseudomonadota bacterium]